VPVRRRAVLPLLVAVGVLTPLLASCGSAAAPDVERVASVFENPAVDAGSRCDLLAPRTRETLEQSARCPDAIGHLPFRGGEVGSVQIWGGGAQAKVGGDTVFLTQTQAGWKVTAALCQPRGEAPYACQVEGP
jgi:hypothetical protein